MPGAKIRIATLLVSVIALGLILNTFRVSKLSPQGQLNDLKEKVTSVWAHPEDSWNILNDDRMGELAGPVPTITKATQTIKATSSASARRKPSAAPKLEVEDWTGVDVWAIPAHYPYNDVDNVHRKVSSVSTPDGNYFLIDFGASDGYNANIIPHHEFNDTYIVVSQYREHSVEESVWWAEIVCNAKFKNGVLTCLKDPLILPIAATFGKAEDCPGENFYLTWSVGPHDARVFWGPEKPYVIYGSNSDHPCLGMWIQDFRLLIDYGHEWAAFDEFKQGTELTRPDGYNFMEKNWFVFWDDKDQIYVHHDIYPQRVFAQLEADGSTSEDMGPDAHDEKCMAKYMPSKAKVLEGIHQATNSLSITLCNRADPTCIVSNNNTFIFTIFHHKSYYAFHGNYEPFVMVFQREAPFSIVGIAKKPIFIQGRTRPGDAVRPPWLNEGHYSQTEMFYVTSMAWAAQGQKYHGYLDDILLIGFGIEDQKNAGIDVLASELFLDLGLCGVLSDDPDVH